jgi:transcriptional regulator with XRE-family HTH domain
MGMLAWYIPSRYYRARRWETAMGLTEVFGQQVRKARRMRDWSQQELADRVTQLTGRDEPMAQAQVAKIEAGRRQRLAVEDVMVFAAALEVNPVNLLLPLYDDAEVDFGIGPLRSEELRDWFSGVPLRTPEAIDPNFIDEFRPVFDRIRDSQLRTVTESPQYRPLLNAMADAMNKKARGIKQRPLTPEEIQAGVEQERLTGPKSRKKPTRSKRS